mgnify:CR=1 FL=1
MMRKIVLLAMLVCTGTFAMAQNEAGMALKVGKENKK